MRPLITMLMTATLLFGIAPEATATVWSFSCPDSGPGSADCPNSNGAGTLVSSELKFDDATLDFNWIASFEPSGGSLPEAFWIVVDNGPEPENTTDEMAILYADVATGRVSAYVYDKVEGEDSWQTPGLFIQTFPAALNTFTHPNGNLSIDLTASMAVVNSFLPDPNWAGLRFNEEIGFWIAALEGATLSFGPNGEVTAFDFGSRSSYDRHDRTTIEGTVSLEDNSWGTLKSFFDF